MLSETSKMLQTKFFARINLYFFGLDVQDL